VRAEFQSRRPAAHGHLRERLIRSIVWNGPVTHLLVAKLQGTDRRSIGRSEEVVGDVLADPARETVEPDRSRPSSHLITGIVVRALAAHPRYRHSADTRRAAELVKSRFFRRDVYPDRAAPSNWLVCCCCCVPGGSAASTSTAASTPTTT
jgi:hypothetical protein